MLTGPVGIAYASQRGAIIGMRSHYRHTCVTMRAPTDVRPQPCEAITARAASACEAVVRGRLPPASPSKDATGLNCPGKVELLRFDADDPVTVPAKVVRTRGQKFDALSEPAASWIRNKVQLASKKFYCLTITAT